MKISPIQKSLSFRADIPKEATTSIKIHRIGCQNTCMNHAPIVSGRQIVSCKPAFTHHKFFSKCLVVVCMVNFTVLSQFLNWDRFNGHKFSWTHNIYEGNKVQLFSNHPNFLAKAVKGRGKRIYTLILIVQCHRNKQSAFFRGDWLCDLDSRMAKMGFTVRCYGPYIFYC